MFKSPKPADTRGAISLRFLLGIALALVPIAIFADGPAWWTAQGVKNASLANDYAVANQGQVKNIASAGVTELDANLPGGAGDALHALAFQISGTTPQTSDYAAVNLGQLKDIAKPFYDRLIQVGYTTQYPWLTASNAADDYAMANIGQVKNLFGFDVAFDGDIPPNGLPDWWERHWFNGQTGLVGSGTTVRNDGLTILQAYQQGLDPTDFYSGTQPSLVIDSGDGQFGDPGSTLTPLAVKVASSGTHSLINAPLLFSITSGGGYLTLGGTGTGAVSQLAYAPKTGKTKVFLTLPNIQGADVTVKVTPGSGSYPVSVSLLEHCRILPPVLTPCGGYFALKTPVTFTTSASNASIHYTISNDGNSPAPTLNDPQIVSGGTMMVGRNMVIQADAWVGSRSSAVVTGSYGITGAIGAGYNQTFALKFDGNNVWGWGANAAGQLGIGTTTSGTIPALVSSSTGFKLLNVIAAASGSNHSVFVKSDGTVWVSGTNTYGQLGNNGATTLCAKFPVQATGFADGISIVRASAGGNHTLALDGTGQLWAWGGNANGQLGIGGISAAQMSATKVILTGSTPFGGVTAADAGMSHSLAVAGTDSKVYAWGLNSSGQLGINSTTQQTNPTLVVTGSGSNLIGALDVAGGSNFSLAVLKNGTVWSWGANNYNQLGNGLATTATSAVPVLSSGTTGGSTAVALTNVIAVAAGQYHALALTGSGTVLAWGYNASGQLGNGGTVNQSHPVAVLTSTNPVTQLTNVVAIAAGNAHSVALTASGQIYTWGEAANYALGNGTTTSGSSALAIPYGTVPQASDIAPTITLSATTGSIEPATIALSGSASDDDTISKIEIFNGTASIGTSTTSPYMLNLTDMVSGTYSFTAVATDSYGLATTSSACTVVIAQPVVTVTAVTGTVTEPADSSGTATGVFRFSRTYGGALPDLPLSFAYTIAGSATPGTDYVALTGSATILSGSASVDVPVSPFADMLAEGPETVVVTLVSQPAFVVGSSSSATVTILDNSPTVGVTKTADTGFSQGNPVAGNFRFTRSGPLDPLTVSYSVYSQAAGGMEYAVLPGLVAFQKDVAVMDVPVQPMGGLWTTKPLTVILNSDPSYLIASGSSRATMSLDSAATGIITGGGAHTLARNFNGTLLSWGYQGNGRLGNNIVATTSTNVAQQVLKRSGTSNVVFSDAIAIGAGTDQSLAVDSGGYVYTFGNGASGQLGNNTTSSGTAVSIHVLTGTSTPSYLGGCVAVDGGENFSLALSGTGAQEVWSWGSQANGRLGNAITTGNRLIAGYVLTGTNGSAHLNGITGIAAGQTFALAMDGLGGVWAWGGNDSGQLGNGLTTDGSCARQVLLSGTSGVAGTVPLTDVVAIAAGYNHSVAVRQSDTQPGTVWCWGQQGLGRLGNGLITTGTVKIPQPVLTGTGTVSGTLSNIVQVVCGPCHTLALDAQGQVWAWGDNSYGQLGISGTATTGAYAVRIDALKGIPIAAIGAGGTNGTSDCAFSYAIAANGTVYSWGYNLHGELGISGTTTTQTLPQIATGSPKLAVPTLGLSVGGPYTAPATATLTATISDASVSRVEFYQGDRLIGTGTHSPYSSTLTGLVAGNYPVSAIAYNSAGYASPSASGTIVVSEPIVQAPSNRYARGSGTSANLISTIIALDFEKGMYLDGNNNYPALYPNGLPWFLRTASEMNSPWYHVCSVSGTTVHYTPINYPVVINGNTMGGGPPLVAFGSQGGGSPLYINQSYNFGLVAGGLVWDATNNADIVIEVYQKSDFNNNASNVVPVLSSTFTLPRYTSSNAWSNFSNNGYVTELLVSQTYNGKQINLDTHIQYVVGNAVLTQWGQNVNYPLLVTHRSSSTDFVYKINYMGVATSGTTFFPMAVDSTNTRQVYNLTYSLDFNQTSPWQSAYIDQPHFQRTPLPSAYQGKSLDELIHNAPPVTDTLPSPTGSSLTTVDNSPELRSHPTLDKFVTDMGSDPMALANYVLNEIDLTDAMGYNANGSASDKSINPTGVSRNALATFLEGQGSPAEQCALLVYLLRKTGVSCGYVFPQQDGMLMFDEQLSKLLRMQIRSAVDDLGIQYQANSSTPTLIPVNYPWVVAYINNKWVHIFPWLKDTAVEERYDLWGYMPEGCQTGAQWLRHYLLNDPNIRSLSADGDNPGTLFPLWINKQLQTNYPDMSSDDLGINIYNRRNYYTRWEDFPRPWQTPVISGSHFAQNLDYVQNPNLTTVSLQNIFDTVNVQLFKDLGTGSVQNGQSPMINTGTMRLVDLHDRRFLLYHQSLGNNQYKAYLSLEAFRPSASGTNSFLNDPGDLLKKQVATVATLLGTDSLLFQINYQRHRQLSLSGSFTAPSFWTPMLGFYEWLSTTDTRPLRTGDMAALCMDYGRVSQRMQEFQAAKYWNYQQQIAANPPSAADPEQSTGELLYLMGLSYYNKVSQFQQTVERLTKTHAITWSAHGLAKLSPLRNSDGTPNLLPGNGDINLVYPNVDMAFQRTAWVGNGTSHLDSGDEGEAASDAAELIIGEVSADEHRVINQFFGQSSAVSTVKLLDLVQGATPGSNVVKLDASNYVRLGATNFTVPKPGLQLDGTTRTLSAWAGDMWGAVTSALTDPTYGSLTTIFMTPGPKTASAQKGTPYTGMGAFILGVVNDSALISGNIVLNGGYGEESEFDFASFYTPSSTIRNTILSLDWDGPQLYNAASSFTSYTPPVYSPSNFGVVNTTISNGLGLISTDQFNTLTQFASFTGQIQPMNFTGPQTASLNLSLWNNGFAGSGCYYGNMFSSFSIGTGVTAVPNAVLDPVNVLTGEFYIDAVDLKLNGPMPLEIRRNYGSLNPADNSFGHGWRMSYFPYVVFSSTDSAVSPTLISAAEADGSVIKYRRQTSPNSLWIPTVADNPAVANEAHGRPGGLGNVYNNRLVQSGSTFTLTGADGSVRTFAVQSFPVSGTSGLTRTRPYLQTWKDSNGNSYTFTSGTDSSSTDYGQVNRIQSSNGDFVGFYYDTYGHITEAYTGDGRRLYYTYDTYGDLVQVMLPDASTIDYSYQHLTGSANGISARYSTHLMTQETKPGGRVLQNDYDTHGRVTVQRSTVGSDLSLVRSGSFNYGTPTQGTDGTMTGTTVVHDALGNTTTYNYSSGQVTGVVDPSNVPVTQQWFLPDDGLPGSFPRSLKSRTDKRGLVTAYQYDSRGNLVQLAVTGTLTGSSGTADTATTTMGYNSLNLLTSSTDAIGNVTIYTYGDHAHPYLPTSIEKRTPLGSVSTTQYLYQDVFGGATSAYGLPRQTSAAVGTPDQAVVQFRCNANGFLTSKTEFTNTGDPSVINSYTYNLRGELTSDTDAAGRTTQYTYDGRGNRTGAMRYDEYGSLVSWQFNYYNQNGEIEWTQGPRYAPDDYVLKQYDGAGRLTQETKWRSQATSDGSGVVSPADEASAYATTFRSYDKIGNLLEVDDPNHNATRMTYDALGQMLTRTVCSGPVASGSAVASESFTYEAGGKVSTHTTVLNGSETNAYTSTGLLLSSTMADGTTKSYRYDLAGRVVKETLNNSSYWTTAYDDYNRQVTRTFYNGNGIQLSQEITVTDLRGNVITKTDKEGNTFTFSYDALNRLKTTTGPATSGNSARQTATHTYDAAGVVHVVTDGVGNRTVTTNDAEGRPLWVQVSGTDGIVVRQTAYYYPPDHQSVVSYEGTGSNTLTTTTWTDTYGSPVIVRHGNNTLRRIVYDNMGNPIQTVDEESNTTTNTYDAFSRLLTQTLPGGATTTFIRDAAGNVLERRMPEGQTLISAYDNASRKLTEALHASGTQTRAFSYSYYTSGPCTGLLQTTTDPNAIVFTPSYDDFLRTGTMTAVGPSGGGACQNQQTFYGYDRMSRLTSIAQTTQGVASGSSTLVTRHYDGYGQIKDEEVYIDGVLLNEFDQTWDAAGRRTALQSALTPQGNGAGLTRGFGYSADGSMRSGTMAGNTFSFNYDNNGLLHSRQSAGRTQIITSRDALGRVLNEAVLVGSGTALNEGQHWTGRATRDTYTATRNGVGTENRGFGYNGRGQALSENYSPPAPDLNFRYMSYRFDFDSLASGAGLGVRTLSTWCGYGGSPSGSWETKYAYMADAFERPFSEVESVGSTHYTHQAGYDSAGQQTGRSSSSLQQTLTWDASGRLIDVQHNDAFDFRCVYDGLGRRLRTVKQPCSGSIVTIDSFYDPQVEFLELGVAINGARTWKVQGPDLNGGYGSLQGIGGLEATVNESNGTVTHVINDAFGDVLGWTDGSTTTWNSSRVGSYGVLPGYSAPVLDASGTTTVIQTSLWRSRRIDPTGFYYLGARYYEPNGGRFLSPDPLGHASSMSLYDYANGDPVNGLDPDGRCSQINIASTAGFNGSNPYEDQTSAMLYGNQYGTAADLSSKPEQFTESVAQYQSHFVNNLWSGDPKTNQLQEVSNIVNCIPLISGLKGLYEYGTGRDVISGRLVDSTQAATQAILGSIVFIPEVETAETATQLEFKFAQDLSNSENTYLYQKLGAQGEHLKFGTTISPATRYSAAELNGGSLRILAEGESEKMLYLERQLHETLPIGPEEGQKFYIQKQVAKGLRAPPYTD